MTVVVLTSGTSWTNVFTVALVEGWGGGGTSGGGGGGGGGAYTSLANPTGVGSTVPIVIGSSGTATNWNSGQLIADSSASASGTGGLAANCTPSSGAFSGGSPSGGGNNGGGGCAGPDGAGLASSSNTGGNGDNGLGGAGGGIGTAGAANVLGGGGDGLSGASGGIPGGGDGLGGSGVFGTGQLRLTSGAAVTYVPISRWPLLAPILAQ